MMRSLLTSGWGIANCPCMVYAWPPAKKTGGIAGFGRYGMVGPFGGDCGEFRKGSAQGDRFLTAPAVTENRKFDTQEWRRQVTGLYGGGGGKYPVKCTRIQNPKTSVYSRCWRMQVTAVVVVAEVVIEKSDVVIIVGKGKKRKDERWKQGKREGRKKNKKN